MIGFYLPLVLSALISSPDPKVDKLISSGNYSSAYELLLDDADRDPGNPEILYLLGVTSLKAQNGSLYLKEYLQKFPEDHKVSEARRFLLDYYSSAGMFITASKLYPDIPRSNDFSEIEDLYRLAVCRQQLGEYDGAREIFLRVIASGDRRTEPWARLGTADCDLLDGNPKAALDGYKALIDDFPDASPMPFALVGISESYRRLGQFDKAQTFYDLYREKFESSPQYDEIEAAFLDEKAGGTEEKISPLISADYYIQVGVFGRKSNAESCVKKFRKMGYRSRMDDFKEGGQKFFRVVLGPYKNEASARSQKAALEISQGEAYILFIQ